LLQVWQLEAYWLRKLMADLTTVKGKRAHQHRDRQPGCARAIKESHRECKHVVNHHQEPNHQGSRVLLLPDRKMLDSLTKLVSEKKSAYCNVGMGLVRF
jgi:hypothetical protein